MRALIEREVVTPEPDEAACLRFYEQNRPRFRSGDLYEAAHILIVAPAADGARARRSPADRRYHSVSGPGRSGIVRGIRAQPFGLQDLGARSGGRLGQLTRGQTVAEFEAALQRMRPGEIRHCGNPLRLSRRSGSTIMRRGSCCRSNSSATGSPDYLATSVQHRALAQYVSVLAGRAEITGVTLAASASPLVQ